MKVLSVVGARPQFVKLAPISQALQRRGHTHFIVHTGQHYDQDMSADFFALLQIPSPDVNLHVGSGSHGVQTGAMMAALDPLLASEQPDWVLVYGDTNSTLAAALCAGKLQLPLAHLEAGLRSFNRRMPEEHNRVLTDHASDLCLAPSELAMSHLAAEGLASRSTWVGDVMVDVLYASRDRLADAPVPSPIDGESHYILATIHRPENTDSPDRLRAIIKALQNLPHHVYLAMHPRLRARCEEYGLVVRAGALQPIAPLSYTQVVQALISAACVITDSGGLQKEAFLLGAPTVTVRGETEWPETLTDQWNVLSPDPSNIASVATRPRPRKLPTAVYGDGEAAQRAVRRLETGRRGPGT